MTSRADRPRIRVAGIVQRDDAILMVRHEKNGSSYWLLPGGGVDRGETLHKALQREFKEEVTLDIEPGELILVSESIAPDQSRHMVQCVFTASIIGGEVGIGVDERVVEARFVSADELADLEVHPPLNEELSDGIQNGFQSCPGYIPNRWLARDTKGN